MVVNDTMKPTKAIVQINMADRKYIAKISGAMAIKLERDVPVHEVIHLFCKEHRKLVRDSAKV